MPARGAAGPSSFVGDAPALRALRRFFILDSALAGVLFLPTACAVQLVPLLSQLFAIRLNRCATCANELCVGVDKPPRVIKLQNFSRLAEACARQSSARSKTGIFRHTKSSRDASVSCGFRQPNHKIDFLGHITARRALICDAASS